MKLYRSYLSEVESFHIIEAFSLSSNLSLSLSLSLNLLNVCLPIIPSVDGKRA